jgi:hypothetical protein
MANHNSDLQGSMNLAEAGLEEAMLAMNNEDWSSWSQIVSNHYYSTATDIWLANGRVGNIKVYTSILDEDAPIIFAEGEVQSNNGTVKKQIRVDLSKKGIFANGLTAKNSVVFNGNKIDIDSYNSNDGAYDPNNVMDNGSVASNAISIGAVTTGNADIWGYVATGGGFPDVGAQGSIKGEDTPNGVKVDLDRIALDFYANFLNISAPTPQNGPITTLPSSGTIGSASAITPTYYEIPSYSNQNNDTLIVDGPVVIIVTGSVTTKGEIQVTSNGSVEFYVAGDIDISGNGMVNTTDVPANMLIFGTNSVLGGQSIKIAGNGALEAAIYAPNANFELKGSGSGGVFMGAAVANNITMTGNFDFHYDEALDEFALDTGYKINRWRELIDSDEKVPLNQPSYMTQYAVSYDTQPVLDQPSDL